MSLGDVFVGLYLVLVIGFLAWQWSGSPAVEETDHAGEPADWESGATAPESRKAA